MYVKYTQVNIPNLYFSRTTVRIGGVVVHKSRIRFIRMIMRYAIVLVQVLF